MAHIRAAGNVADGLGMSVVLASIALVPAVVRTRRGASTNATSRRRWRRPGHALSTTGDLHVGLADVLVEQGELAAAEAHLQAAADLGERGSLIENRHRSHLARAALLRARGDLDGAVAALDEARSLFLPGYYPDVRPIPALTARVRIAQGRVADARAWADDHQVDLHASDHLSEFDRLTLARLMVAEQVGLDDVIALTDRVVAEAGQAGRGGSVADALVVRALAHDALGDRDAALAALGEALDARGAARVSASLPRRGRCDGRAAGGARRTSSRPRCWRRPRGTSHRSGPRRPRGSATASSRCSGCSPRS